MGADHQIIEVFKVPSNCLAWDLHEWSLNILILRKHQSLARLCYILKQHGLFKDVPVYAQNHLHNSELLAQKQYRQVAYEANQLESLIKSKSKKCIFLKGAAYSLSGYHVGFGRTYSDIDVLVPKKVINDVEKHLNVYGWLLKELSVYDQIYYRKWSHEIPPLFHGKRGTILDLHHNIVPVVSKKAPNVDILFDHTQTTDSGFTVLAPYALFLHSAIHLFFNEDFKNGFRDIVDLKLLAEEHGDLSFWSSLFDLAYKIKFEKELALAIRYLRLFFDIEPKEELPLYIKKSIPKYQRPFLDFIFLRVLAPKHRYITSTRKALAEFLALARGHYLKMPLHILLYHTMHKLYVGSVEYLLGSSFFHRESKKR